MKAGETSRPFQAALHLPPLDTSDDAIAPAVQRRLHDATGSDGGVDSWLLGTITYQSPFGGQHWTNFCVRARRDGTASGHDEHPYAERT